MVHTTARRSTGGSVLIYMGSASSRPNYATTRNHRNHHNYEWQPEWPFRFLDLPPELRNRIYHYIFTAEAYGQSGMWEIASLTEHYFGSDSDDFDENEKQILSILQTCRQIHNEASAIPYNCNIIRFQRAQDMAEFMGRVGILQIHAIHRVAIQLRPSQDDEDDRDVESDFWSWGMLKLFPNLRTLRLIDVAFESEQYLNNPSLPIGQKIRELRGVQSLEVMLEEDAEDWTHLHLDPRASAKRFAAA